MTLKLSQPIAYTYIQGFNYTATEALKLSRRFIQLSKFVRIYIAWRFNINFKITIFSLKIHSAHNIFPH